MDRLKAGDIIEGINIIELKVTEEGLNNDGYGFIKEFDILNMRWKIQITEVKEAADQSRI